MLDEPGTRSFRIGHGFLRGEGLGGDDEEGALGVDLEEAFVKVRTVHIRHEVHLDAAIAEGLQCFNSHAGP